MTRSIWKKPYISYNLIKQLKVNNKKHIKVYAKESTIYPEFLNKVVEIYNGKKFIKLKITENLIGHKFGEFINTRIPYSFKGNIH